VSRTGRASEMWPYGGRDSYYVMFCIILLSVDNTVGNFLFPTVLSNDNTVWKVFETASENVRSESRDS